MSGAFVGNFNVPQIVCVFSGTFPFKKSLTLITGIDSNSITSPSPFHFLAGGGPLDNTVVGIKKFKVSFQNGQKWSFLSNYFISIFFKKFYVYNIKDNKIL